MKNDLIKLTTGTETRLLVGQQDMEKKILKAVNTKIEKELETATESLKTEITNSMDKWKEVVDEKLKSDSEAKKNIAIKTSLEHHTAIVTENEKWIELRKIEIEEKKEIDLLEQAAINRLIIQHKDLEEKLNKLERDKRANNVKSASK